mgnify:CR=1 FL=1
MIYFFIGLGILLIGLITVIIIKLKELKEIEESKQDDKIHSFCSKYNISEDVCKLLLQKYKLSLTKLGNILNILTEDLKYPGIDSLPFMSKHAIEKNYTTKDYGNLTLVELKFQEMRREVERINEIVNDVKSNLKELVNAINKMIEEGKYPKNLWN